MAKLRLKFYGVSTGRILKDAWVFFCNLHERVKHFKVEPIEF